MAKLEARGLTRHVDGHALVEDVSFTVNQGRILVVVGPSGAGKTTLLRLLNRLDEPTEGQALLDGEPITAIDPLELRRRIGLVPNARPCWGARCSRT
jgi:putative ABC transport system ATP-binding protein